jgi:hypothetical protein
VTRAHKSDSGAANHGVAVVAGGEAVTGHRSPVTPFSSPVTSSSSEPATLHLRSGKDHPVRLGHPWIFSGAIKDRAAGIEPGSIVRVLAADGRFLGTGYVNPRCDIAVRLLRAPTSRSTRRSFGAASPRRARCVAPWSAPTRPRTA